MSNVEPGPEGNEPATPPASGAANAPANPQAPAQGQQPAAGGQRPAEQQRPVAAGGQPGEPEPPTWPTDWRERMAKASSTDDKSYAKELKRLERYTDPLAVNAARASLEQKLSSGLVKIPGKKATPEEIVAYREALGIPEKPEEYAGKIKLSEGKVLGDADKPMADYFAKIAHAENIPPAAYSRMIEGMLEYQQEQAAETFKAARALETETRQEMQTEWGAAKETNLGLINVLFQNAPGGADPENETSLMAEIIGGTTKSGKVIGNWFPAIKWMSGLGREINPAYSIVPAGGDASKNIDSELAAINKRMQEDRAGYFKDEAMQDRFRELVAIKERIKGKAAA